MEKIGIIVRIKIVSGKNVSLRYSVCILILYNDKI